MRPKKLITILRLEPPTTTRIVPACVPPDPVTALPVPVNVIFAVRSDKPVLPIVKFEVVNLSCSPTTTSLAVLICQPSFQLSLLAINVTLALRLIASERVNNNAP